MLTSEVPVDSSKPARAPRKGSVRVRRGLYVESVTDEWERYRLQSRAVLGALAPTAFLTGPTAAVMRDLPMVGEPPETVFVRGVPRGRYGKDVKVVSGANAAVETHEGMRLASMAWTVADCARVMSRRDALIVADAALRASTCQAQEIETVAAHLAGCTGVDGVRWVAANCDPGAESPGESWLRMVVTDLGYDVQSQVVVGNSRVDLLIRGTRVVLEFDGAVKYQPDSWRGAPIGAQREASSGRTRGRRLHCAESDLGSTVGSGTPGSADSSGVGGRSSSVSGSEIC